MNFADTVTKAIRFNKFGLLLAVGIAVSGCQGGIDSVFPKAEKPIPDHLIKKMKAKGMTSASPILLRIYKSENVLEVWKQKDTGRYDLLETYEICKWSGKLGPKFKEGDRQAPEGFYNVGKGQLNPQSQYHLSFNIGYPNSYDRSHGRSGTHLMVHGACSSAGCYSMTDELVEEIYALARDAIKGGQDYFQVQAYPFRMTAENLAKNAASPHFEFWKMLKEGSDHFEITNYPPKVDVCEKRYLFNREAVGDQKFSSSNACPPVTMPERLLTSYKIKLAEQQAEFEKALKREQARAKFKGSELANMDISGFSIIAAGNEVLPPATPVPEPVMASNAAPSKTEVTISPEDAVVENSGTQEAAIATEAPASAEAQETQAVVSTDETPVNGAPAAETSNVTPIPQPAQRAAVPVVEEVQTPVKPVVKTVVGLNK
ncbi:MAG: hypothetical protein WBC71_05970 [Salaquimonas sp.]